MKLTVEKREGKRRSELTRIRAAKDIPAVFYAAGRESELLTIKGPEFMGVLQTLTPGHLPTTVFELEIDGKVCKAIVREIQYHKTTYDILHLDFQELLDNQPVEVNVPVDCLGVVDAVGVKLGGFVRLVKRHVKVRCESSNEMPEKFELDIRDMNIGHARRVSDLTIPKGVTPLLKPEDVLVVIAKR